jgi:hypothetical protein
MRFRLRLRRILRRRDSSIEVKSAANSKKALERSIDIFESIAHVGAVMVVIGVIVEYKAPLWTFLQTWDAGALVPAIGGILIAFGVGLEVLTGLLASGREHQLRDINAREVAELNLRAEKEHHARVKLEEKLAPRSLSNEQRRAISDKLRPYSGTHINCLSLAERDGDVLGLGSDILTAIIDAGWMPFPSVGDDASILNPGVIIEVNPQASASDVRSANELADALRAERVTTIGPRGPSPGAIFRMNSGGMYDPTANIRIVIARRP